MKKSRKMRSKFIQYFLIFSISIFAIIWILQVVLITSTYKIMMKREVEDIGNTLSQEFITDTTLDMTAYKNNLNIVVLDSEQNVSYVTDGAKFNSATKPTFIDTDLAVSKLNESGQRYYTYTIEVPKLEYERLIYVSKLSNGYLILSSNVEPIGAAVKVLSTQLIYISIVSLIISIFLSNVLSRKITKSITQITKSAKEIGRGNYDVEFKKTEYEEINTLADTLNYSVKELKQTDTLRKELIANVSHDIRTPITIMKSYSEMIKDISGDNKEKREEHLDVIISQADLLTRLTEDMMDLSKLETGVSIISVAKYNLLDSVKSTVKAFQAIGNCKYELIIEESITCFDIIADKTKMEQVLYNLISNAINYVGQDETVYIHLKKHTHDNILVEVEDHGKGIKEQDLPNIFNRYYKSNDKYRKSGFGTGLGLSIVKNILQMHGFKYGVTSEVGKGTIFYFVV